MASFSVVTEFVLLESDDDRIRAAGPVGDSAEPLRSRTGDTTEADHGMVDITWVFGGCVGVLQVWRGWPRGNWRATAGSIGVGATLSSAPGDEVVEFGQCGIVDGRRLEPFERRPDDRVCPHARSG